MISIPWHFKMNMTYQAPTKKWYNLYAIFFFFHGFRSYTISLCNELTEFYIIIHIKSSQIQIWHNFDNNVLKCHWLLSVIYNRHEKVAALGFGTTRMNKL